MFAEIFFVVGSFVIVKEMIILYLYEPIENRRFFLVFYFAFSWQKAAIFNVTHMSSHGWRILKSRTRLTVTLFYKSRLPQLLIIAVIHVGMQIRSFNRCLHGLRLLLTDEVNNIIWMGTSASGPGPRGQPGLNNVNTRWTTTWWT